MYILLKGEDFRTLVSGNTVMVEGLDARVQLEDIGISIMRQIIDDVERDKRNGESHGS